MNKLIKKMSKIRVKREPFDEKLLLEKWKNAQWSFSGKMPFSLL